MDKYPVKFEGKSAIVEIPAGPAKGIYSIAFPQIDEAGMIHIGYAEINGKEMNLKVKASEMPSLVAFIESRDAAFKAQLDGEREAAKAEMALDAKMREAGFEAAGNGAPMWNRLNRVNGNNF